jgi:hypothetical protein
MDSIIEDSTNNHISLLKVILIFLGKDIDLNKDYKITELNDEYRDFKEENINSIDEINEKNNDKEEDINDKKEDINEEEEEFE